MVFTDPFDEELATSGPAAVFTLTHEGELQLNLFRSRELRRQNHPPFPLSLCHCVLVDQATRWPQYALITSPALCVRHERAIITKCASYEEALQMVDDVKQKYYQTSGRTPPLTQDV